jgi:hypothetical protein
MSYLWVRVCALNIKRDLRIVYRKDKHLTSAAQTFITMARDKGRSLAAMVGGD